VAQEREVQNHQDYVDEVIVILEIEIETSTKNVVETSDGDWRTKIGDSLIQKKCVDVKIGNFDFD
jgi:hypothetical protein